jgi:Zn-dependent M16 (insulinase) family peptidase
VAIVRVMLQYLSDQVTQSEIVFLGGPCSILFLQMYNLIRGRGLTYGISMSSSVTEGRIRVKFSRSSQLDEAYRVFRKIIREYSDPEKANWDATLLDSARGSQIYEWAAREETLESLSSVSVKSVLRGARDNKYNRRFVKRLASVTIDEIKAAAAKFLPQFLEADVAQTAVACGPAGVDKIVKTFAGDYGIKMNVIEDIEDSVMSN